MALILQAESSFLVSTLQTNRFGTKTYYSRLFANSTFLYRNSNNSFISRKCTISKYIYFFFSAITPETEAILINLPPKDFTFNVHGYQQHLSNIG